MKRTADPDVVFVSSRPFHGLSPRLGPWPSTKVLGYSHPDRFADGQIMPMISNHQKLFSLAIILLHLAISIVHGRAHQGAMVMLTMFGNVYVLGVIMLAPLVAGALLFTRWAKTGALLLAISMLGSFAFGAWYHFLSATNDNVSEVHGSWRATFFWTAIALALVELLGAIVGLWAFTAARMKSRLES